MNASPVKRRALASLDINAPSPTSKIHAKQHGVSRTQPLPPPQTQVIALSEQEDSKKRPLTMATEDQPAKKLCRASDDVDQHRESHAAVASREDVARNTDRHGSASPAPSSVFDSSGIDTSQATNFTEPDADVALVATAASPAHPPILASALPPRRVLTREESRQRAEILKLRLSLANYKIRTGQIDVPLERLQVHPQPTSLARKRTPLPSGPMQQRQPCLGRRQESNGNASVNSEQEEEGQSGFNTPANPSPEKGALPRLAPASAVFTPRRAGINEEREEKLTSSALRGGAVSGLLSLSLSRG